MSRLSWLWPRLIDVFRPGVTSRVGQVGYSALQPASEAVVLSGLPARISSSREARPIAAGIPSGTMFRSLYKISFRAKDGVVRSKDVVKDDLGNRYQVLSAQYGRLGWDVLGELMEV